MAFFPAKRAKYEIYDYDWSYDVPGFTTNSYREMQDMIKGISEGCVYENGFKKFEILDGKKAIDYSGESNEGPIGLTWYPTNEEINRY